LVSLFRIFGLNLFEERRRRKKETKKKTLEKRKRKEKKLKVFQPPQLDDFWLKARRENRNFIKSYFVFFWRSPITNSINMATLALLFCFVSPKFPKEKSKNKSISQCSKVTGTHRQHNNIRGVRLSGSPPFHPSVPSSVPSSVHPSSSSRKKNMMEEEDEEDDDKWWQQQFIQTF
jgi:hypothetical protein